MNDLIALDEYANALEQVAATELRGSGSQIPILKLSKQGEWSYGRECIEPDEDSVWALHPLSLEHGWVSWGDGEKLGELMFPITARVPGKETLGPAPGEPWTPQYAAQLRCVSGDDEGEQVLYVGTSLGLKDALGAISKQIVAQIRAGQPALPLLRLSTTHYIHKKYGKIFKPELELVAWGGLNETQQELAARL